MSTKPIPSVTLETIAKLCESRADAQRRYGLLLSMLADEHDRRVSRDELSRRLADGMQLAIQYGSGCDAGKLLIELLRDQLKTELPAMVERVFEGARATFAESEHRLTNAVLQTGDLYGAKKP